MARVSGLFGIGLALLVGLAPGRARADDDSDRAEQAFSEGNRAFAAGDYHAAFDAYRAAWSSKQTFDIACNLGRTEVELSLSRDAAEHLDYCLRTFSVSSRGEVRDANKRFRELFQRVRRLVGALTLEVRPAGAEITVDGASYGVAPLARDIFLTPGPHLVKARLSGFEDEDRSVTADAGGSLSVTLALTPRPSRNTSPAAASGSRPGGATLAPAAGGTVAPPSPASGGEARGMEPRTIVLVAGGLASVVALGVGFGFMLDADAARGDASRLGSNVHQSMGGACTVGATSPGCVSLRDAVDREQGSRDTAGVLLLTGALLGAATVGSWLVIPDLAHSGRAQIRALPWIGRRDSGVALTGTY